MIRRLSFLASLAATCLLLAAAAPAHGATNTAFGAWTPGSPFGGQISATNQLEGALGRRISIVHWFQDFAVDRHHFRWNVKKAARGIRQSGRRPLLTWEPYVFNYKPWGPWSNKAFIRGQHDRYIKQWARRARALHKPIFVRFAHEMNGGWYPWGGLTNGNSPKQYRRMWRHVVKVVRSQGAWNVKWVWSPLCEDQLNAPKFQRYYPGTRYVDVLGMSGFNWGAGRPENGGWRSFKKVFRKGYKKLSHLGPQPIWITEVASASDGGDKGQWIRDMWATAAKWDRLKAIVWYNQDKERDWAAGAFSSSFAG
jgi:hypothetical protein